LLVLDGDVRLADFSLAAMTTSPMGAHRRVGTMNYTAPELLRGWLSDRSDQYSLAVTYCELRTGQLPFPETPPHAHRDYVRPPPDLSMMFAAEAKVLRRALSPVPQDRWRSCSEMMERLRCAVQEVEGPPHAGHSSRCARGGAALTPA